MTMPSTADSSFLQRNYVLHISQIYVDLLHILLNLLRNGGYWVTNISGREHHFLNYRTQAEVFHMSDERRLGNPSSVYAYGSYIALYFFSRCPGTSSAFALDSVHRFQTGSLNKVSHGSAVGGYGIIDSRQDPASA